MRIRIVQAPPIPEIDGIRLDCFHVGREYDVGNSIGSLFLAEGWAEPLPLDAPKPIEPFTENDPYDARPLYDGREVDTPRNLIKDKHVASYVERDIAADIFRYRRLRPLREK